MDFHTSFGHDKEPVLNGTPFDETLSGTNAHFLKQPGDRDQGVAGYLSEESGALQKSDSFYGYEFG